MHQMARKRQQDQTKSDDQTSAAETLIEGRLAGSGFADRLRALSPVTAGLVLAVLVAVGLSAWPYLAPLVYPEPDDPWKTTVDQDLADVRTTLSAVTEQQAGLAERLETVQSRLDELDGKMAGLVRSVTQSVDTVNTAIDRFDRQVALIDEKLAQHPVAAQADETNAAPQRPAEQDSAPAAGVSASETAQKGPDSRFLPDLSLPELSGWWQRLSGWFGGLISVDRVSPEQDQ